MSSQASVRPSQSRIQRTGDAVVRSLLRSPLHRVLSGRLLLVTVLGRKSGREYTNPVGYADHDGALLVGTTAGWRRNLRDGEAVRVRLRGSEIRARAEVIADEARLAALAPVVVSANPIHGRYAGIELEPDGTVDRDDLRRAMANGYVIVRLSPV
ncbi:nitroreductase family deazaflavin-dependent oxidoreductase [Nocardia sp. NPDC059691]|uniref:nitroreductase family deazaflavin-dependent oxidoreductase n=1 Tax=Nocardia sp. NPDC059691 TaxID=3346908 RepID=UPI00367BA1E3